MDQFRYISIYFLTQAPSPNKRRVETSRKLISAAEFIPGNMVFKIWHFFKITKMKLPIKAHEDTFFSSLHSDLRMKSFLSAVVWWESVWHLALLYLLFTGSLFQKLFPSLTNKIIFLSFFKRQPFWVCCKLGK